MAVEVLGMIGQAFAALVSWFELVLSESGFAGIYLSGFFLFLVGKFLLQPLFGSAGSDKARSRKDVDDG